MWPTIPANSLVEIEGVRVDEVRAGDIVVWQQAGQMVAHRAVELLDSGPNACLVTKGDNCSIPDQRLSPGEIIGRVVALRDPRGVRSLRDGWRRKAGIASWVLRWRLRSVLREMGRPLPPQVRGPLTRFRDRLGYHLSQVLGAILM
jgi:signal peptidase I